jgi:DNA helicase II / ATP-dependent DNA helicase PcrA
MILNETEAKILNGLNTNQLDAVQSIEGSTVVIAGAGSGKTAVLTRRVAYLISKGEVPGSILCLTFTNKAAKEMNERVHKLLASIDIQLPHIAPWQNDYLHVPLLCTFHSLGVRILREFGEKINLKKEFTILDTDDQKKIIRTILKDLNLSEKNLTPSLALYFISQCKQESLESGDSRQLQKEFLPIFHQIYHRYEENLRKNGVVDFDDLILRPFILLRENPDVVKILQDRWHHIMIDEFQDTNQAQFELVKLLCPTELLGTNYNKQLSSLHSQ